MVKIAIIALICAALFTGAAAYITLVEHPARLELAHGPLLAQWKPSYDRALPIQSGLAIARGIAGMGGWHLSGNLLWVFGNFVLPPTGRSPCLRSCRPTNAQSGPARGGRAGDPCAVGVMGEAAHRQERAASSVDH
jgi:hypothetical protein